MKKSDILKMESIAYYSGLNGLEIKKIEYDIDNYVLCVSGAWGGKKTPHRIKVHYEQKTPYFTIRGYKIPLNECIRM